MFDNILVPVDFSARNAEALAVAVQLAELHHGQVIPFHVIQVLADASFEELADFYTRLQEQAAERMQALIAPHTRADISLTPVIVLGERAAEIITYAAESDVDLIVLSSHKIDPTTPTEGWGTISYKVGILAQCPVMLVK